MTSPPKQLVLLGPIREPNQAMALNAALREKSGVLDWSGVTELTDGAADALVAGLELDEVADGLNADTMSEEVQGVLAAAFERAATARNVAKKKPRPKKTAKEAKGEQPEQWTAPSEPPPRARPGSGPPRRLTPLGVPIPRLLASEVPKPAELRRLLEERVLNDLLGPAHGPAEELTESSVRERYLVGMLAPRRVRIGPEQQERVEVEEGADTDDGSGEDTQVSAPTMFPSAIGLSFVVDVGTAGLTATARWGRYRRLPSEELETEKGTPRRVWKRNAIEETVALPTLEEGAIGPIPVGLELTEAAAPAQIQGLARRIGDVLVVSLFLVNMQDEPEELRDQAWLFQPELSVQAADGRAVFRSRALSALSIAGDDGDRAIAMRYRDRQELAVGHGVGVDTEPDPSDPRRGLRVSTKVVPAFDVPQLQTPTIDEEPLLAPLVLDMKELAETPRAKLGVKLRALPDAYEDWIRRQRARIGADPSLHDYATEATKALDPCERALTRLRDGLALLAASDDAAEAFRFANRAMYLQRVRGVFSERRRRGHAPAMEEIDVPKNRTWRTFQLAFILINLDSVTRLHHQDRSHAHKAVADLLWFPTGGGKTEAYLGLAAYTMALRRLQGDVGGRSGEHGVAVLMRYTLRLLTLQQFQRAAALICACEFIRREAVDANKPIWGHEPFRIGLWVGSNSTPNKTEHAAEALKLARDVRGVPHGRIGGRGSPVQLKSCPWCGATIDPGRNMHVEPKAGSVGRTLTFCGDKLGNCPFSSRNSPGEGLPVLVVDEEVYRRLPTLLIATVDKFAQMPWNGATQMLFGQVNGYCERHGFTSPDLPCTDHKKTPRLRATTVKEHGPLRPPDLIIQDELHLISGPLGTMTGLYETAIDALCSWDVEGTRVRPKVIASTATIRRAEQQIKALFLRDVQIFPPPAIDAGDNFFARERPTDTVFGRRYIGICAPGRRLKAAIIRVYVALLSAGQSLYEQYGQHADPWMTLVGYFSSLRELAGTRRLVDDDIQSRVRKMDRAGLARRLLYTPHELTSRMASTEIPELLDRLELPFDPAVADEARESGRPYTRPIDVLLATNMISVGVDVQRLGLMVTAGQPKNTAEYIQATSRVGRQHPGLVCTIYNWARPRDLSHYETFAHYHATFYNRVEALSVTPFAPRALDRGLSALLVTLVRLSGERFNPNEAAAQIDRTSPLVTNAIRSIERRAELVEERKEVGELVHLGLEARLDQWLAAAKADKGGSQLGYKERKDGVTRPLLTTAGLGKWDVFTCLSSLRDVEAPVPLVLDDHGLDDDPANQRGGT